MLELFQTDWKDLWGEAALRESVGSVFTRPEIVDLILDLSGYVAESGDLSSKRVLEPSCGSGAFVHAIIRRLLDSRSIAKNDNWDDPLLSHALRAVDIDAGAITTLRENVKATLTQEGCPPQRADCLVAQWIIHSDFLLYAWNDSFDFILGNPPYVRIEDLPKAVLSRYRENCTTATDRADLYIAFIERGLQLLSDDGALGFICANRFAKNRYGKRLRELITSSYHVRWYINLEHTQPFVQDVSAYPAILIVDKNRNESTFSATIDDLSAEGLQRLSVDDSLVSTFPQWYSEGGPWISTSYSDIQVLEELHRLYPPLGDSAHHAVVGIGVATGADKVFILPHKRDDIEESRQLPLLLSAHIGIDELRWTGEHLVNPFREEKEGDKENGLVRLEEYPLLNAYFQQHGSILRGRYVARAHPHAWYRTIDKVHADLTTTPKLVIPDIQGGGVIGYDRGEYYPHHNVYWITSDRWNLRALQSLLRSSLASLQVAAFSVQMRGGSLRYQAQTLRRICLPLMIQFSESQIADLEELATSSDVERIDEIVNGVIGLSGRRL